MDTVFDPNRDNLMAFFRRNGIEALWFLRAAAAMLNESIGRDAKSGRVPEPRAQARRKEPRPIAGLCPVPTKSPLVSASRFQLRTVRELERRNEK